MNYREPTAREILYMLTGAIILALAFVAIVKMAFPQGFTVNPFEPVVLYRNGSCTISRFYDMGEWRYWAECQDGAIHASEVLRKDGSNLVATRYGVGE